MRQLQARCVSGDLHAAASRISGYRTPRLTEFGQDIDIVVRPRKKTDKPGRIALIQAA